MKPTVFLFDLDGVVIKKHYYFRYRFAEDFGVPLDQITTFFNTEFQPCLLGQVDLKEKISPFLTAWGWKKSVEELLDYWFSYESELDQQVLRVVRTLRTSGIPCSLATNNEKYRTTYIKENLGLAKEFDHVFSSSDLGLTKPDPKFWKAIMEQLQLPPDNIVLWDDDAENVVSAQQAGLQAYCYITYIDFQQTINRLLKLPPLLTNPTNQS